MLALKCSLLNREYMQFPCNPLIKNYTELFYNVSTGLFPSNGYCTVTCLHSCYFAVGLHVTICSVMCWQTHIRRTVLLVP
jgi:hypothetical protein